MLRIFKHYIDGPAIMLAGGETLYLFGQSFVIYHILPALNFNIDPTFGVANVIFLAIITTTGMACVGLYNRQHFVHYGDVISRTLVIIPFVFIFLASAFLFQHHVLNEEIPNGNYVFSLSP